MKGLLEDTARRAARYLSGLPNRSVAPPPEAVENLNNLDISLPDQGLPPAQVISMLDEWGSPAAVASAGGRYFGFVTGGSLPASLAANLLAGAWDQNAGLYVMSPIAARLEEIAERWLNQVLDLPPDTGIGFVSGATMANFSALAAARHFLLQRKGWNVEKQGLYGAPEIKVVVGEEYHASMKKALNLIGLGSQRVTAVPVDDQGRMRADRLPEMDDLTLLCIQAGNVNTGAFDPAAEIIPQAQEQGAWVHVDGAFGLWARSSSELAHLAAGLELADSIATDAHKWLNVPYDSGLIFVKDPSTLVAAMTEQANYLIESGKRENFYFTPEMSRRASAAEIWAALLSLGRAGLAELVETNCRQARRFAEGLTKAGFEVLNNVDLNQVLVSFGSPEKTNQVITAVQAEGTMWAGGTVWQGHTAMRISVSSWATTDEDIEKSLAALVRVANQIEA